VVDGGEHGGENPQAEADLRVRVKMRKLREFTIVDSMVKNLSHLYLLLMMRKKQD
jgi:hypothetical protein